MESRVDYVAGKVAESLTYEALLAIIATECRSPNQTAKMCLELGIAPEGEKVAKWVAVLKREFPSSRDFLGTLKRIYDAKTEAEMAGKSLEKVSQETGVKIIDKIADVVNGVRLRVRSDKILEKRLINEWQVRADLKQYFINPWMRRLAKRLKRIKFDGRKCLVVCDAKYPYYSFKYTSEKDVFPENTELSLNCKISLLCEGRKLLTVDLRFDMKTVDVKGAYGRISFSKAEIEISAIKDKPIRQARALAKWMAKNKVAKVIEINGHLSELS